MDTIWCSREVFDLTKLDIGNSKDADDLRTNFFNKLGIKECDTYSISIGTREILPFTDIRSFISSVSEINPLMFKKIPIEKG